MSYQVVKNGVMTGTAVVYSEMWSPIATGIFSLHCEYTGTPTGVILVQETDKNNPNEANDDDWVTIQATQLTPVNPAGAGASWVRSVVGAASQHYRLKYTNATGSGTLNVWANVPRGD